MDRLSPLLFLLASTVALATSGCHPAEPRSPEAGLRQPADPPKNPDLGHLPDHAETFESFSMYVNDSVRSVCSGSDPFFKFDSAKPTAKDAPTMQTLVNCMQTGALRGKTIKLVGRTDPRGTEEYNEKLGLDRAERVKKYLVRNGVDGDRVQTGSLGKDDASPFPKDWAGDRRVEVVLVK